VKNSFWILAFIT